MYTIRDHSTNCTSTYSQTLNKSKFNTYDIIIGNHIMYNKNLRHSNLTDFIF